MSMKWSIQILVAVFALAFVFGSGPRQILFFSHLLAAETQEDDFLFPDDPPPEPEGYRMKDYRTMVPLSLKGARVVTDVQAMELHKAGKTLFIDVMPMIPKPPNLPEGTVWRAKPRKNIPDSVWLANVGYGLLPQEMKAFFQYHLQRLTNGKRDKPLLFYCQKECWMSWNAAKRALEFGYKSVTWYPLGTDGWVTIGGKLVKAKPVPLPNLTRPLRP